MYSSTNQTSIRSIYKSDVEPRNILYLSSSGGLTQPTQRLRSINWHVIPCRPGQDAVEGIEHCQLGIVHFSQFDPDFVEYLHKLFNKYSGIRWLALVEKNSLDDQRLRLLIRESFFDFHTLPMDIARLNVILGHAHGFSQLLNEPKAEPVNSIDENGIVGVSPHIVQLRNIIKKAATTDSPVLIIGESGTGKELVASSIHAQSAKRGSPFVAVNCASLPATLIQSELFGHEKGAFTGAHARKIGRIESAAGGTLFLDEIGDLSTELQVNLLRFLQEKTITRVGGHKEITVDARIIAATNIDLARAVEMGTFRRDLYYRLNVIQIKTTPLRERREDIEFLARHFLNKFKGQSKRKISSFSSAALMAMHQHDWPGNVREISNQILRALVIAEGRCITVADLDLTRDLNRQGVTSLDAVRADAEAEAIMAMLVYTKNNISETARLLGVTRGTLYRLLNKHSILQSSHVSSTSNETVVDLG